jgi:hypothetical protein
MKSFLNSRKDEFANYLISKLANWQIGKFFKLIVLILSMNFLVSENSFSQEIEWQRTIGGSGAETFEVVKRTMDGGFILGGSTESIASGNLTGNTNGGADFLVVKINSVGNIEWQNTIGGTSGDELGSLWETSDGGYILGGCSSSDSSGDKKQNSKGGSDYWVVKIDIAGNIEWERSYGGSETDRLTTIQQTSDHGYILGGFSSSGISGDKTESTMGTLNGNSNGDPDYWILKLDSLGNIQWQNTIGGFLSDILKVVHQTVDGGYFLAGYSYSFMSNDKSEHRIGGTDVWIVKTDSLGNIVWDNTLGGTDTEILTSAEITKDGGFILGAMSESGFSGDKTSGCYGFNDFWVVKLDVDGDIEWQKTIGGNSWETYTCLKSSAKGGYYLGGTSWSGITGQKTEPSLYPDYWVLNLDSIGEILWQNTIGGNFYDELISIEVSSNGDCIVGGHSISSISIDKTENSFGGDDFWVLKLTSHYNLITGRLFVDFNSNGIQDSSEPSIPGKKINEQSTGRFSFSQTNGNYSVAVLDTGNYTVSTPSLMWYYPNPALHSASFTGINQTDSLNDFAYQPIGNIDDVCVTITPLGQFRSGFTATYQINYGNYGTTTIAPTVYFYPDTNVTFQSATLTPSQITPDSVVWSLPAMLPFQTGSIIITVNVDLGLPIGTLINSRAHIEPYLTDANPSCNNSNWEVYTTGSFDPNDIIVNRSDFTTTELSASPWLEYIIRFQNTGNDTAFTVKILNPIDTNKLDISSIEFVNASHPVNINWINYQRNMEFKFNNILLPDSNTNEPLSHGFVRYRIQPKTTLNAGDSITNFAAIYFDFNEPVITNTAKTIIVLPTGLANSSPTPGKLLVFPNPSENSINISGIQLENGKAQLRLMDIYGKLIFEKTINETSSNLETDQLSKGVYLIQSGGRRATFVKQ